MKLQARTVRTLVFALAFPVWLYGALSLVLGSGVSRTSMMGVLVGIGMAVPGCAAAWLAVRPVRIEWFRWPWWSFALLGLGWAVRAWLLADLQPWPWILANLVFYLAAVGIPEEFIFRGCVEDGLSQFGPLRAAIVAGLFFGATHAPLAILRGEAPFWAVFNTLGGGVLYHLAMRWLRNKGGLAVPVLVHGLLDFLGAR
ncbi:MAG TPA: CPBP family intramembrane glutamic endopeptidase [Symbiobacteriaceae bacterium]|nr:CPBP family intramembrane glutamic endopeptidase [Symbiobacteriaceae bacterium]